MNSEAWQTGAKVRVKSSNQEGLIVSRGEGESSRVEFTPNPAAPAETVTTVIANDDLERIPDSGATRLEFDAGESAGVVAKLEEALPAVQLSEKQQGQSM